MEPTITQPSSAALMQMGAGFMIFLLVFIVFAIVIQWKIFTKANQPGWACIIPIYNAIVYLRIIGRPASWLLVYLVCGVLYGIGIAMAVKGSAMGGLLSGIGGLAILIIAIIDTNRLSKSFGKGPGFTAGLIILGIIFQAILAFGSAKYIGPNGVGAINNDNPEVLHS